MNANDRKQAAHLLAKLETIQERRNNALEAFAQEAAEVGGELRDLADAENEKFENMTEGLQNGERGQAIQQAGETLSNAADYAENTEDGDVSEAIEELGNLE